MLWWFQKCLSRRYLHRNNLCSMTPRQHWESFWAWSRQGCVPKVIWVIFQGLHFHDLCIYSGYPDHATSDSTSESNTKLETSGKCFSCEGISKLVLWVSAARGVWAKNRRCGDGSWSSKILRTLRVKQWLVIDEPLRLIREKVGNRHIQGNGGFFTSKGLI